MKTTTKKFTTTFLAFLLLIGIASAQSRYKHLPRVKIEPKQTVKTSKQDKLTNQPATIHFITEVEESAPTINISTADENEVATASAETVTTTSKKHTTKINRQHPIKTTRKVNMQSFTEKIKANGKLLDIKDLQKTNMETILLVMILLYIVGGVMLIIGLVLLLATYNFTTGLVLLLIGSGLLLAASTILTLYRLGIF
jgi:hypothetical protein